MHQQRPLYSALLVHLHRQLFNFVNFGSLHQILLNAHCKSEHAQHAQHMVIVVKKAGFFSKFDNFVATFPQFFPWFEKLGLLYVRSVHLIQLPIVTVCVNDSCIAYFRIYGTHMFQAPQTSAYRLSKREIFRGIRRIFAFPLNGEKDWN